MILSAWFLVLYCLGGASYHVATDGDDDRSPLQAQNPSTPWKSFEPLRKLALQPGDCVLLHRGDVFRGSMALKGLRGNPDAPVVIASYGAGSGMPVISGAVPLRDWTRGSGRIWSCPLPSSDGPVARLLVDGIPQTAARLPATGWFPFRKAEKDSAFSGDTLPKGNWMGAWVHLRSQAWNLDARRISGVDSTGRITFAPKSNGRLNNGWGWFISGVPAALSAPGQWAYDSASQRVLWWPKPGQKPSSLHVEAAVIPHGIQLADSRWVEIDGIGVKGQSQIGIFGQKVEHVTLRRCRMEMPDQWGVHLEGAGNTVENCFLRGSECGGLWMMGPKARILHDTVEDINRLEWFGPRGQGGGGSEGRGISMNSDSGLVSGNEVHRIGYNGIVFGGLAVVIDSNHVDSACTTSNDCAGIYHWSTSFDAPTGAGTVIENNWVGRAQGNSGGCPGSTPAGHGIYLDDRSHDMVVRGNQVIGNERGIFLHNTRNVRVIRNLVRANRSHQISIVHDGIVPEELHGNVVDSNLVISSDTLVPIEVRSERAGEKIVENVGNWRCQEGAMDRTCNQALERIGR
jgi:parallel beta-helix repeat protein